MVGTALTRLSPPYGQIDQRGQKTDDRRLKNGRAIPISVVRPPSSGNHIMAKANIFKFMQEVRDETQKVTWPTRRETAITTAMVFVMVAIASVFFLVADQFIRLLVTTVLNFAS